jgi:hypothetical protein
MNIALFANPAVFAPLQGFYRWLTSGSASRFANGPSDGLLHGSARAVRPMQRNSLRQSAFSGKAVAGNNRTARDGNAFPVACPLRPLRAITPRALPPVRMIRVREAGQARSSVGRMVISGRMADVCAELDRLVACEAALH